MLGWCEGWEHDEVLGERGVEKGGGCGVGGGFGGGRGEGWEGEGGAVEKEAGRKGVGLWGLERLLVLL